MNSLNIGERDQGDVRCARQELSSGKGAVPRLMTALLGCLHSGSAVRFRVDQRFMRPLALGAACPRRLPAPHRERRQSGRLFLLTGGALRGAFLVAVRAVTLPPAGRVQTGRRVWFRAGP